MWLPHCIMPFEIEHKRTPYWLMPMMAATTVLVDGADIVAQIIGTLGVSLGAYLLCPFPPLSRGPARATAPTPCRTASAAATRACRRRPRRAASPSHSAPASAAYGLSEMGGLVIRSGDWAKKHHLQLPVSFCFSCLRVCRDARQSGANNLHLAFLWSDAHPTTQQRPCCSVFPSIWTQTLLHGCCLSASTWQALEWEKQTQETKPWPTGKRRQRAHLSSTASSCLRRSSRFSTASRSACCRASLSSVAMPDACRGFQVHDYG